MTATADALARSAGRPRSAEADDAILRAAVELFAETGFEGLTVEAVAARAGVGKATVYRRYSCKVDLVAAACRAHSNLQIDPPDTGSFRTDVRAVLDSLVAMLTESPVGRVLPTLVADKARIPELAAQHRALVREKRRRHRVVVERAVERGELRPNVAPELVMDACAGPVFYRFLVSGAPLDGAYLDALADTVARAFAPELT